MRPLGPLALIVLTILLSGCLFGSPSPSPSATATTSFAPSLLPSSSGSPATAIAVPTPGPDAIPTFTAGTRVTTSASGLRVRSKPGTGQSVITLLPTGSNLVVELGPVRTDSYGWYLVRDADADAPAFDEGWVAAGFMPKPFLSAANFELPFNPIVAGFAHEGDGEFGPVVLQDANYEILWVASVLPGGGGCSFSADLVPKTGTAVPAVRATLGTAPAPGVQHSDFFASHPELVGDVILRVTSDCSWALTFVRVEPAPA
jgi:hypothetical protein